MYSLSILMTAPVSEVRFANYHGDALYGLELLSAFFILSVLFSLFAAGMSLHGKDQANDFNNAAKDIRESIREISCLEQCNQR